MAHKCKHEHCSVPHNTTVFLEEFDMVCTSCGSSDVVIDVDKNSKTGDSLFLRLRCICGNFEVLEINW